MDYKRLYTADFSTFGSGGDDGACFECCRNLGPYLRKSRQRREIECEEY